MTNSRLLLGGALVAFAALAAAALLPSGDPAVRAGRDLYVQHCAACHGAKLEGQPDWRSPDRNGLYPAPPHDETGHSWHHDDAMLLDYITRGGQAVLDEMDVEFTSGMPGFGTGLSERDIAAILDHIKASWPKRIRLMQEARSRAVSDN